MVNLVLACSVCGLASVDNNGAYLAMTLMLSGLPLAFIGGVVYWVRARVRAAEDGDLHSANGPALNGSETPAGAVMERAAGRLT